MSMSDVVEGYRLSPQQQRLLSLYRANGNAGYGAWLVLHLTGTLDLVALKRAVELVVRQNEILRTQFQSGQDQKIIQVILEDSAYGRFDHNRRKASMPGLDWHLLRESLRGLAKPVVFEREPLFSTLLIKVHETEHLLCLSAAGVVADNATMGLLAEQIEKTYVAILAGHQIPTSRLQYADIAEWWNSVLESPDSEQGRRYWRSETERLDVSSRLPLEYRAEAVRRFRPRYVSGTINRELGQALDTLAVQLGARLPDLLLGCWFILLCHMSQKSDVTIGKRFDGRNLEELKDGIGLFARHLPITLHLRGDSSFSEFVSNVAFKSVEASRHEDSFDWCEVAAKAGSNEGNCLLPVHYGFQRVQDPGKQPGVTFSIIDSFAVLERFKISLMCQSGPDSLSLRFFYDANCLRKRSVALVSERFESLLNQVVQNPEMQVEQLKVVGLRERQKLIVGLNRTKAVPPCDDTVPDFFSQQAERTPAAVAVRYCEEALTYGALDAVSNRLANYLRRYGVGPEVRVAILLPRSVDLMVSILGVWKAGGAFVPLDPAFPRERLRFILQNAAASLLITNAQTDEGLADISCPILRIEKYRAEISSYSDEPLDAGAEPRNLAYLIYTSGSTGTPKGIAIEHRSLTNYVKAVTAALDLPGGANYALISTVAADLGNTMIYPALCNGGTLHIISDDCSTDPEAWADYVECNAIDCLKIVPSHFRLLLESSRPGRVSPRQRIILGGEASDWRLIDKVSSLAPDCRIFNHYGPTETTVGVLTELLAPPLSIHRTDAPSLGRPLAGSRVYILDQQVEPVPMGSSGELHVGGQSLARGYVDQPALTAARFIPDPFGDEPGARLYRTGDLVRHLYDGRIEFLGRTDHQVKIRGYRVELGEIETVLTEHPDISTAKVITTEYQSRHGAFATWLHGVVDEVKGFTTEHQPQQRVVAYLVPRKNRIVNLASVKALLARKLPDYCTPSQFLILDHLPLNKNGKVDPQALRELKPADDEHTGNAISPRTPIQSQLLDIWRDLLGRSDIGITDNFFEVGGNSFLAIRLMARIQKRFSKKLPLAILISAATVEEIADLLSSEQSCQPQHLVTIRPGGGQPPLYCVHPGHGGILCYQTLSKYLSPTQPVYGLQALDFLYFDEGTKPFMSIEEIAARHVAAIAQTQLPGKTFALAGWSFGGMVVFEMARQLEQQGNRPSHLFLFDCRLPITASAIISVDPKLMQAGILFDYGGREISRLFSLTELVDLTVEEQLALVAKRTGMSTADLVPEGIDRNRLDSYLTMRSARIEALRQYTFRPYGGKITLFRAQEAGSSTQIPELQRAFQEAAQTADYGWNRLGLGGVEVISVPGTHDSLLSEPHVGILARELTRCIRQQPAARVATDSNDHEFGFIPQV